MNPNWKRWVFKKAERILSKASSPLPYKEVAWKAVKFAVACGQSHPFSFVLRPVADHKYLRQAVGVSLVVLTISSIMWAPLPSLASDTGGAPTLVVLPEGEAKLETQEAVKWPTPVRDISQRFWVLHAGIDIRMPVGTPINPVMAGKISEIELGRYGYGKKVIVIHGEGYKSLYAHLSEIIVKVGDRVNTESVIGLSGNSGRSTGPHLHLEILHNNKHINPLAILK